ncbi:MAG: FtsH protease activity modulator HflK [wastewater metagenome]|nr:FtsH protease activity modulator HflK [Candidatus Loosdrechtia aerotolerans]
MPENSAYQIRKFQLPPNISGTTVRLMVLGVALFLFIFSSAFTVDPEEVGVILRFGKYTRTVNPGLHFKLPFGIETVDKVPVERQLKQEFGFRTVTTTGIETQYLKRPYQEESLMLTGDLNAADVEWIVQYRVKDPYKYLYRVRSPDKTFRDITEAVMREIIGDRSVVEVLTFGRQEIADAVTVKLQDICDQYETGIRVEQVALQDVNPPDPVKPAFNEVNEAQQEREKLINQARSEYNRVIPKAKGEAAQKIEEAEGYALERINEAQGDAAKFHAIFTAYMKAEEVTRQRIYLETMSKILPKVGRKLITDQEISGILPLFQLNGEETK